MLVSLIVIAILAIISSFDIAHKFKAADLSAYHFWMLVIYKLPQLFNSVVLLVSFVVSVIFLHLIIRNNELIIILSSGVPIWKIFAILASTIFLLGVIIITTLNPLAAFGLKKYDKLSYKLSNSSDSVLVMAKSKLFFRESLQNQHHIITASSVNLSKKEMHNVILLATDNHYKLSSRIDAEYALIKDGKMSLHNARVNQADGSIKHLDQLELETAISLDKLVLGLNHPEKINIWNLPEVINYFIKAGIPVIKYQLHYFKEMLKPIAMVAMVMVACIFISLNTRLNTINQTVRSIATGVLVYSLLEFISRVLAYASMPAFVAVFLPILFIMFIANFAILHFEEA